MNWWSILLLISFRYFFIAGLAFTVFYVFKSTTVRNKIQSLFPQNKDVLREIGYSVLTIIIFAAIGYAVFSYPLRSYTLLYTSVENYGWAYFFVSILLMMLIHDTYFYWVHRWMHHIKIYKWMHKVHHLSTNPSPWAAYSFHPLEAIAEAGIIVVIAFAMPSHPLAISLFLLFMITYNVYGHLGYELYPKGFSTSAIGKWINTSVNHNQHHQYVHGNYGLYFLWWDRWMGTLRNDYDDHFEKVKSGKQFGLASK